MSPLPRRIQMREEGGILVSVDHDPDVRPRNLLDERCAELNRGPRLLVGCGMIAAAIAIAAVAIAIGVSF